MRLTKKLYENVRACYPEYFFEEADEFRWSPASRTISVHFDDIHGVERLLHELAHAELGHAHYEYDIALLALERDAWQHARRVLSPRFGIQIADAVVEDDLDTYREWMHARSTCPSCEATGLQTGARLYQCPACTATWRVNTAQRCGLRRRLIQKHPA